MRWLFAISLLIAELAVAGPTDRKLESPAMMERLATLLSARRLDAIAAQVPDEPDAFVAALFYPGSQILVISGRSSAPRALLDRLSWKQYRNIYLDLQSGPVPNTTWFLYDMGADGLPAKREQPVDTLYDADQAAAIFDGDWKKHELSEKAYGDLLSTADARYSRLLAALIQEAQRP